MKIFAHVKSGKPTTLDLTAKPLRIWLSRTTELQIDPGDKLETVASIIHEEWGLSSKEASQLAALWFALGERQVKKKHDAPWTKRELLAQPARRYLK